MPLPSRLSVHAERAALRKRACVIAGEVAREHAVSVAAVLGAERRTRAVWLARREVYVRLWSEGYPMLAIARALGRDHTSIMHGLRASLGDEEYERQVAARGGRNPSKA